MHRNRHTTTRHPRPRRSRGKSDRRGAALVEGAFVLSVLVIILFTIFDLGMVTVQQMALSEGARRMARAAAVRGARASGHLTVWGPALVETDATAAGVAEAARPILIGMDPADVSIRVEWLDAGCETGDRVRVTITHFHEPMMPLLLGSSPFELTATSTVRIHH